MRHPRVVEDKTGRLGYMVLHRRRFTRSLKQQARGKRGRR